MAETDCTKKCPVCASAVLGNSAKIYCSDRCQKKASKKRTAQTAKCKNCDKKFEYSSNSKGWYCSRSCSAIARAKLPQVRQALKKRIDEKRERKLRKHTGQHSLIYDRKCIECDKAYHSGMRADIYCSSKCRRTWQTRYKRFAIRITKKKGILLSFRICPETGWIFKADNLRQKYANAEISNRVSNRVAKAKRRARKRTNGKCDNIDPHAVFADVNYVCQICGKQTDKTKRGTTSWDAPELDHIIPLSKGGQHTLDNVQCACRRCNHSKSDTVVAYTPKGGIAN